MSARRGNRSEPFGRLLSGALASIASYEGKTTAAVEEDLGAQIGVAGKTIQRYKAGVLPPDDAVVRVLAEAAVRRAYLGREWLQRFLHAARYPAADQLTDTLCPAPAARPRPPRTYENLPAPTYAQFVMRPQAFADVAEGLRQRSAAVLVVGLGGNGKTSLAREVATRCLDDDPALPRFDAVVWVSDKDRPGTTNLSVLLDALARTLDYPAFTQLDPIEKQHEVELLLRRQRVLVVVDNVETITDAHMLHWLLRLPEPSKGLLTSRERHRALWGSWLVELRGLADAEAAELIGQRLRALGLRAPDDAALAPLVAVTGGNPKALSIALGLVKHERRTLQQVVDDLHHARGGLFDDLFTRAWGLLDEAARRVLLAMSFFPDSAGEEALSAAADVGGYGFDRAIERLVDLSLLDVQQADLSRPPRYTLHSLVHAFAAARLSERPAEERPARERWLRWYVRFVEQVGASTYDIEGFARFRPEAETAFAAARWAFEQGYDAEALALARKANYYYYVRGIWDKNVALNQIGAEAARRVGRADQELLMLAYSAQRLIMQGLLGEAAVELATLEARQSELTLPDDVGHTVRHTFGLYALMDGRAEEAWRIWEENLALAQRIGKPSYDIINRIWLAACLQQRGLLDQAYTLAEGALVDAVRVGYTRARVSAQLRLAGIDLELGRLDSADARLAACGEIALRYQDRPNIARMRHLQGRLAAQRGDSAGARIAYADAADRFERLGLARDLALLRAELAVLPN